MRFVISDAVISKYVISKGPSLSKYPVFFILIYVYEIHYRLEKSTLILRMIRNVFQVQRKEFSDEEITHLCGALYINAHELPSNSCIQAIYYKASFIEHNCLNNASKHFDSSHVIQIRAAVPIQKGEHISITYTDPMWGTFNRIMHLRETKFFTCSCRRCVDPSELQTYFSSLKCQSCPVQNQGSLLPKNPLDDKTIWVCSVCDVEENPEYVEAVTRSIGEELIKLEKSNVSSCKSFLKKHSQNLHPNHYYLMDVKLALCQMLAYKEYNTSDKDLVLKQKLCSDLMNVINIISPGISRLRGVVLYELQKALFLYAKRKYNCSTISLEHLQNIVEVSYKYTKQIILSFYYFFSGS